MTYKLLKRPVFSPMATIQACSSGSVRTAANGAPLVFSDAGAREDEDGVAVDVEVEVEDGTAVAITVAEDGG